MSGKRGCLSLLKPRALVRAVSVHILRVMEELGCYSSEHLIQDVLWVLKKNNSERKA